MDKYDGFIVVALILLVMLVFGGMLSSMDKLAVDQLAVCAVLQKHIPNRSPQVVGGECGLLTGVEEPRVWMSVEDYGKMIMEDEK